jgi:VanZ family protein
MSWAGVLYRAPAVLFAAALFWASSVPRLPLPDLGFALQDKLGHAIVYAVFSLLIYVALARPKPLMRHPHAGAVVLGALYAASDEWHQLSVPGRTGEIGDLVADTVGIVLAQLCLIWYRHRRLTGQVAD